MNVEVEAYLAKHPDEVRERLGVLRNMVLEQCPRAVESMSYGLIGYKLNGHPLIYFGGFKQHVGMYATPVSHEAFAAELSRYVQGKGSVQLPLSEPLPIDLVKRMIAHRVDTVSEELPSIGQPATRALAAIGVTRMSHLASHSAAELLALHGVGPRAIKLLREAGVSLRE